MSSTPDTPLSCPWCRQEVPAGTEVCPECGFNRVTKQFGPARDAEGPSEPGTDPGAATADSAGERYALGGVDAFIDREIPLALIIISVIVACIVHVLTADATELPAMLFSLSIIVAFEVAWMYAGMTCIETFADATFGPWREVVLKLTAIILAWFALWLPLEANLPLVGRLLMVVVGPVLTCYLLKRLFRLDLFWTFVTFVGIAVTRWIVESLIVCPFT